VNIDLERPGVYRRISSFSVKSEIPTPRIKELAWERKSFAYLDLGDRRNASLLTRQVEDFCLPALIGFNFDEKLSYADTYVLAWKTLKERGFPVVKTVRKVSSEKVATSNLVADLLTSVYDQKIDMVDVRDTMPLDKEFVKIPIAEVGEKAEVLLNLANKNGVDLATDGPFHIVVEPNNNWYLILLDIGKVRIYKNPRNLTSTSKHDNRYYIGKTVMAFATIQRNIKALRDARNLSE